MAPVNYGIQVTFTRFAMENYGESYCDVDQLQFFEGATTASYLVRNFTVPVGPTNALCGGRASDGLNEARSPWISPATTSFRSATNELTLRFRSDWGITMPGFALNYAVVP